MSGPPAAVTRPGRRPRNITPILRRWPRTPPPAGAAGSVAAASFNLHVPSISYFGDDPVVEKHYVPRRSQRRKAVLVFLAQDASGQVYAIRLCGPAA